MPIKGSPCVLSMLGDPPACNIERFHQKLKRNGVEWGFSIWERMWHLDELA